MKYLNFYDGIVSEGINKLEGAININIEECEIKHQVISNTFFRSICYKVNDFKNDENNKGNFIIDDIEDEIMYFNFSVTEEEFNQIIEDEERTGELIFTIAINLEDKTYYNKKLKQWMLI